MYTPDSRGDVRTIDYYKNEIEKLLEKTTNLKFNIAKTEVIDLKLKTKQIKLEQDLHITFLGYKFSIAYKFNTKSVIKLHPLSITMSDVRLKRYKDRISTAFDCYQIEKMKYLKKSNRLLISRMKYLTGNTKLVGNKEKVFVGIYFSNQHLTSPYPDLLNLEEFLKEKIEVFPDGAYIKSRLNSFSFKVGFTEKKFTTYIPNKLKQLLTIWK